MGAAFRKYPSSRRTSQHEQPAISLPDALRAYLEEQVKSGASEMPEDYVNSLIHADLRRKADERLENLLIEGLDSGAATPMTDADWNSLRHQTRERAAHRAESDRAA